MVYRVFPHFVAKGTAWQVANYSRSPYVRHMHKRDTPKRTWAPAWAGITGWLLICAAVWITVAAALALPWPQVFLVTGPALCSLTGAALVQQQVRSNQAQAQ